jgi:hypothetical protein
MPNEISPKRNAKWTKDDEIAVFIAWRLAGENAAEASRQSDVPLPTVRSWIKRWKSEGFSDGENQLIEATVAKTVAKSGAIIDAALDRVQELVGTSENIGHLITAIDKLSGHIRLAQGKATVIREDRSVDTDTVKDSIVKYLEGMAGATTQRANEVITLDESQIVEQPVVVPESTLTKDKN